MEKREKNFVIFFYFFTFLFCFFVVSYAFGIESIAVEVIPSSTSTALGAEFSFSIKIMHGAGESVGEIVKPMTPEVLWSKIEHKKGVREDILNCVVRIFDIGEVLVESPEIIVGTASVKCPSFKISVKERLDAKDTEIKKLRGQKGGGFPYFYPIAAALLIALAYFFTRRKRKIKEQLKNISPEEWYIGEIEKLNLDADVKEILDAVSDLYRIYIEKKYNFAAIYLSSSEIMKEMKERGFESEERMASAAFLHSCDLAKFAKKVYERVELDRLIARAKSFAAIKENENPPLYSPLFKRGEIGGIYV